MRSDISAPALAALASGHYAQAQLVLFQFPGGDVALNSSNLALVWDGTTYLGAASLGASGAITDAPGQAQGMTLELPALDSTAIALALDDADEVQGTVTSFRTAIVDAATRQVLDAPLDWRGKCDTMRLCDDGGRSYIRVTLESAAVELLRGNPLTYSDADLQARAPGDRAFEFIVSQSGVLVVWPSREFFFK